MVGPDSVMKDLFTGKGPTLIREYLWMLDDMIAIQVNQADTGESRDPLQPFSLHYHNQRG